jgi:hypothetical protein
MDTCSWELLLNLLLDVQADYLIDGKFTERIGVSQYSKDYNRMIADTVFGTWILSRPNAVFWVKLEKQIKTCRYNIHYVKSWLLIILIKGPLILINSVS